VTTPIETVLQQDIFIHHARGEINMEFFWMILIGMIAGWLAGQFMTGKGFGVVGDIITGMAGALIGGLLFERTGIFSRKQPGRKSARRNLWRDYLPIWRAHGQKA
jgi:uncharacterized membrane protein YeaQ/YmgE (transglycosylase-associated protein family)